jgi:hypothetical protein
VNKLLAVLILSFATCASCTGADDSQEERSKSAEGTQQDVDATPDKAHSGPSEFTLATQRRLNRYFHEKVITQLRDCWSRIDGEGAITINYSFENKGEGQWVLANLDVSDTTLGEKQTSTALECMRSASSGGSFATEPFEQRDQEFSVFWTWPVPLPEFSQDDFAAMMGSGFGVGAGGGCDGNGAAKKCYHCAKNSKCEKVCVGYKTCSIIHDHNAFPHCSASDACASGGPFGLAGFDIIY